MTKSKRIQLHVRCLGRNVRHIFFHMSGILRELIPGCGASGEVIECDHEHRSYRKML